MLGEVAKEAVKMVVSTAVQALPRTSRLTDILGNYNFHLLEVGGNSGVAVFTIAAGFQSVSAPELSLSTRSHQQIHKQTPRKIIDGGVWGDIIMRRGVRFGDDDFYFWISAALSGEFAFRRNLLLIQYSGVGTGLKESGRLYGSGVGGTVAKLVFAPLTDLIQRVPARAWLLKGCIPVKYKSGTDFDATSPELSYCELTISPETVEEFSFSAGV